MFKAFLNHMWPIDYKKTLSREETIRVTLRSLVFYVIFLIIATTVIISMIPPHIYTFNTVIKRQFVDVDFATGGEDPINFDDIRTVKDFWAYMSLVAIPSLYNPQWGGPANIKENMTILFENSVLGVPRLRMLKVRSNSCKIHKHFKRRYKYCFGSYSKSNAVTSNRYYKPPDSYLFYFGSVSIYGSGGLIKLLDDNKNDSLSLIFKLYSNMWITQSTRVVFLDFTLYNPNLNLFCIVKLIFEFPPSGGIISSSSFLTVKLMRYNNKFDFIIMGFEFVYICYIFYFIVQEIRNIGYYKRKYWTFLWTYVNIFIIFGSILLIPFNTYKFLFIPNKIETISENTDEYVDMEFIAFWQWTINNIEAILLFFIWIKIFRFLSLSKTMGQLEATLRRCGTEIIVFSLMFLVVFLSFAQMGYLLFGEQNNHFSTFPKSLMTLLITILGDFDYYAIQRDNKLLAPMFFTTYIFFVFFVLLNMFLAIITGTFAHVKDDIKKEKSELEVIDFLLRLPKNLMKMCCPQFATFNRNKLRLSNDETISEVRRILESCNFSNNEIERFFEMYDIDESKYNKDVRVFWMLNDIKKYKPIPGENIKEEKSTMKAFSSYQERYDTLNIHFSNLYENMDKLATKFNSKPNS